MSSSRVCSNSKSGGKLVHSHSLFSSLVKSHTASSAPHSFHRPSGKNVYLVPFFIMEIIACCWCHESRRSHWFFLFDDDTQCVVYYIVRLGRGRLLRGGRGLGILYVFHFVLLLAVSAAVAICKRKANVCVTERLQCASVIRVRHVYS